MNFDEINIKNGIDYTPAIISMLKETLYKCDTITYVTETIDHIAVTSKRYKIPNAMFHIAQHAATLVRALPNYYIKLYDNVTDTIGGPMIWSLDIYPGRTFGKSNEETAKGMANLIWMFQHNKLRSSKGKYMSPYLLFSPTSYNDALDIFKLLKHWLYEIGVDDCFNIELSDNDTYYSYHKFFEHSDDIIFEIEYRLAHQNTV